MARPEPRLQRRRGGCRAGTRRPCPATNEAGRRRRQPPVDERERRRRAARTPRARRRGSGGARSSGSDEHARSPARRTRASCVGALGASPASATSSALSSAASDDQHVERVAARERPEPCSRGERTPARRGARLLPEVGRRIVGRYERESRPGDDGGAGLGPSVEPSTRPTKGRAMEAPTTHRISPPRGSSPSR